MITFSKTAVNRRKADDEPSPEPFYIIYDEGSDIGELYVDLAAGRAEAFISQGSAYAIPGAKVAIRRHFPEIETTEVTLV